MTMSKKLWLATGVGAGVAAFLAAKKLVQTDRKELAEKIDELLLQRRQRALEYHKYFKDYVAQKDFPTQKVTDVTDRIVDSVEALKSNEQVAHTVASLKSVSTDVTNAAKVATTKVKTTVNDALGQSSTKVDQPASEQDIVVDGRSAFGAAKEAAEFESDHPTETFFPKNQQ